MDFCKSPTEQNSTSQVAAICDSKLLKSLDNRHKRATLSSSSKLVYERERKREREIEREREEDSNSNQTTI